MKNLSLIAQAAGQRYVNMPSECPGYIRCEPYGQPPIGICHILDGRKNADIFLGQRQFELEGDNSVTLSVSDGKVYEQHIFPEPITPPHTLQVTSPAKKWWEFWK